MNNYFELNDAAELLSLLRRIQKAVRAVKSQDELEEFVIVRRLPRIPGRPLVQFIEGVVPKGFNYFSTSRPGTVRKHQATSKKKAKIKKRLNKQNSVKPK